MSRFSSQRRRASRALLAGLLACALVAAPAPSFADEGVGSPSVARWVDAMDTVEPADGDALAAPLARPLAAGASEGIAPLAADDLPEKYDLRDKGLSTSVKSQCYFNGCWAFTAAASLESSLIKQGRGTADTVDLSELQLMYFREWVPTEAEARAAGAPGQAGEGVRAEGASVLYAPAFFSTVGSLLMRGTGFIDEADAPYKNQENECFEGKMQLWGNEARPFSFWRDDRTWSVEPSLATKATYQLQDMGCGAMQQVPAADVFPEYGAANPDAYLTDPSYIEPMKRLLLEHGVVAVNYCSESAEVDGEVLDISGYTNQGTAAVFFDRDVGANHSVAVVGWDDTFSKENFVKGHQPPADGAWIVKNSWGSADGGKGNQSYWGLNGSGYCYLSYYDATITECFWLDAVPQEDETALVLQHDLLGMMQNVYGMMLSDEPFAYANVFTAPCDMTLESVGLLMSADSAIETKVYLLRPGWTDPVDGNLAAQVSFDVADEVFGRIALDEPVKIAAGQEFSLVQTYASEEEDGRFWYAFYEQGRTEEYVVTASSESAEEGYEVLDLKLRGTAVINPGESYLGDSEGWDDFYDVVYGPEGARARDDSGGTYGNLMLKAYGNPAQLAEGEGVYVAPAEPDGDGGDGGSLRPGEGGAGDGGAAEGSGSGNAGAGASPPSSEANGSGGNGSGAAGSGSSSDSGNGGDGSGENAQPDGGEGESDAKTDEPEEKVDVDQDGAKESQSEGSQKASEPLAQTGDVVWPLAGASLVVTAFAALAAAISRRWSVSHGRHAR